MPVRLDQETDRIAFRDGPHVLGTFRWQRNRLHDQPGVLRLVIDGFTEVPVEELPSLVDQAVEALSTRMRQYGTILVRTVLPHSHPLLPLLLARGFAETRRTLLPVLRLDQPSARAPGPDPSPVGDDGDIVTTPLEAGLHRHSETAINQLYWTLYRRTAHHDPATPEHLTASERNALALGDPHLDHDASVIAERAHEPTGLCTVYRTADSDHYELGIIGATTTDQRDHRHFARQMLTAATRTLRDRGVTYLHAEIDTDDPYTLYALAEWPFQQGAEAVTLTLLPHWQSRPPRQVVRLVLFDPQGRVLLVQHREAAAASPSSTGAPRYWVLPGGGRDSDETPEDAAERELLEETGIRAREIGRLVWVRRGSLLRHGEPQPYVEHYFLAKAESDAQPPRVPPPTEEGIVDVRWWPLQAIADSHETFYPAGLAELLTPLAHSHLPEAPLTLS